MSVKDVFRKRFIINTAYFGLLAALAYVFVRYAMPLVSPFILAFVIAFLLHRPANYLSKYVKLPKSLIAFLLVVLFYGLAGTAFTLLGIKAVGSLSAQIVKLPDFYAQTLQPMIVAIFDSLEDSISRIDPALVSFLNEGSTDLVTTLGNRVTSLSLGIIAGLSDFATALPSVLIKALLMIISTFFIALDYDKIVAYFKSHISGRSVEVVYQIRQYLFNTLFVVIRSYLLIMTLTFTELSIGFSIIGLENALLIALAIAIFDILPVLGTGGVMIPWIVISFLQGNLQLAFSLLVIYGVVTVVRNIVEPKIVGGQLGLHPVVTLMSMFVGASLLGAIGLFGFPIGLSLLQYLSAHGIGTEYMPRGIKPPRPKED